MGNRCRLCSWNRTWHISQWCCCGRYVIRIHERFSKITKAWSEAVNERTTNNTRITRWYIGLQTHIHIRTYVELGLWHIIHVLEYIKWTRYFRKWHSFTIFQLYDIVIECIFKLWVFSASFNFCLWRKLQYYEKTTDLPEVTGKTWSHIEDTALLTGNRTYKTWLM